MNWSKPSTLSRLPRADVRPALSASRGRDTDRLADGALGALAAGAVLLLALVFGFLVHEAAPVLRHGDVSRFFESEGWFPLEQHFGILPMVWATLAVTLGAVLLAAPLGLGAAIYERFYASRTVARIFRSLVALLAGIPSVVFGLWGLTVLVPLIARWQPPGTSLLAAILVLALMILPTVAVTSSSVLSAVPQAWLRGAAALGMTRKGLILGVALPAARPGVLGGIVLATARALGETMAVLMVAGNVVQTPRSLFDPVRVLTANIALEMAYAMGEHRAALFATGLLLAALTLGMTWAAMRVGRRMVPA
jgi:phosphate transport system permease protein